MAEGARFENAPATETIEFDLLQSNSSQSLTEHIEEGEDPIKPHPAK
jgi:hypothetical protein